ncbi:MAG: 4Fe-4S dicluster domain-containing protein [Bacillus subtilis]|nr:4Fe-4S dicluster domain-containing protein [Bacillus subtilis]
MDTSINEETIEPIRDECGSCQACLQACPGKALSEDGYAMPDCLSYYNQSKQPWTDRQIDANYCLFGCDICQLVCPKNAGKGTITHPEFALSGKEAVSMVDLFTDSETAFETKYADMAYLWKGKSVLMRNAAALLAKQKNHNFDELIKTSLIRIKAPWYRITVERVLKRMESKEPSSFQPKE